MHLLLVKLLKNEYGIWLKWVLATLVGFLVSLYWVEIGERSDIRAVEGAIGGVAIGLAQWFVLKQRFSGIWWWILASAIGWGLLGSLKFGALGWVAPKVISIPVRVIYGTMDGAMVGALIGVGQWLVLKKKSQRAGRWILASTVGWSIGLAFGWTVGAVLRKVMGIFLGEVVGLALGWVVVAAITGVALCHVTERAATEESSH
ncbi:MAG: hypothetical protein ICV85_04315 [Tolypothrix sp. T3-bin4]|nr:hypothetical protein [Tolypothrix sp. T3-bin4]